MTTLIQDGFWFTSTMVWFPFEGLDGERIAKGYEDAVSVRSFLAADPDGIFFFFANREKNKDNDR